MFYGGEKNSNCNCTNRCFVTRGRRIIKQKCNRNCTSTREAVRFLQYIFPCTKEMRKNETHEKIETPNRYLKKQHFKMDTLNKVLNVVKLMDWAISINLTDAYLHIPIFSKTPNIFKVLFTKSVLPMENAVLIQHRHQECSPKLYQ